MSAAVSGVRSHLTGLLLGLALVFGTGPSAAVEVRIVTPAPGGALVAGQLVEVRWDRLPAPVDEMELLLELNTGALHRLRLTPQLDGASRSYLWTVPNLAARDARLRLRWGRDGAEVEGEPSAPFAIRSDSGRPFERVRFSRGEWWVGDGRPTVEPTDHRPGRVVPPGARGSLRGVISLVTEVVPDETGGRQPHSPHLERRRGFDTSDRFEPGDHGPLTIPLRP